MPYGVTQAWEGWVHRKPTREWEDPTFWEAVRRLERRLVKPVRYSHALSWEAEAKRMFWDGSRWVDSPDEAERFNSEFSAWDVGECLQDGFVEVELMPE